MHQFAQVAPVALVHRVGPNCCARAPVRRAAGTAAAFGALLPVAGLCGARRPARPGLPGGGRPRRAGPGVRAGAGPAAAQAHALPGDATNVRIDMTENDGLDVIVAASGGRRLRAGRAQRGGRPVPTDRRGHVERRHRRRVRRPVERPGASRIRRTPPPHPSAGSSRSVWPAAVRRCTARSRRCTTRPARRARSTRCRSSSTWPTPCPASRRRAGPLSAAPGRRG